MKVELNNKIKDFLQELVISVILNEKIKNLIMNVDEKIISYKDEETLLNEYKKYGIYRKSLEYDVLELLNNPYFKNIKLNNISYKDLRYVNRLLQPRQCLNMNQVQYSGHMVDSYSEIGYFNKPVKIPILTENGQVWMSSTLSEYRTIQGHVDKAKGKVLTFGLGIGYYPYMCLLKDNVDSITILEINKDIIDMFKKYILPQFNTEKEIKIIQGDIFDFYNEEFMSGFNYIFVDTWNSNDDGLNFYKRLMQTGIRKSNISYWIEDSIIEPIKMLMAIYFKSIATNTYTGTLNNFNGDLFEDLKRIHKYFRKIDKTITDPQELLGYINNIDVIRDILSIK